MRIPTLLALPILLAAVSLEPRPNAASAADRSKELASDTASGDVVSLLPAATELLKAPLQIHPRQRWENEFTVPERSAGQAPVLFVRARRPQGGGGGAYLLRILIDGQPLRDHWFEPRLLNKSPSFTPRGMLRQLTWFRDAAGSQGNSWLIVFHKDPHDDWSGTGHDFDYLFDLSGLATGKTVKLGLEDTTPDHAVSEADQVSFQVESLRLAVLPQAKVQQLRQASLAKTVVTEGGVEPRVPEEETGQQAYELTWSGRPDPGMQVTFEELDNWLLRSLGESNVSLTASVAQRLWRPRVGKLVLAKSEKAISVALCPKNLVQIATPFDGVNFWVYGHKHFMHPDAVAIRCRVLLTDAVGADVTVDLGPIRMGYWMLLHGHVPAEIMSARKYPLMFKALLLQADQAKADYTLYLEGLHFYRRNRQPELYGRPEKPVFPLSDRGMLPTPPAGLKIAVEEASNGARFAATGAAGTLVYEVHLDRGCLDGITARWGNGDSFQPCAGGGLLGASGPPVSATLIASRVNGNTLEAQWQTAAGQRFQTDYSLQGMSLVVTLRASGGWAKGTAFGEVAGLASPKTIEIPYLALASNGAMSRVVCGGGLFLSILPDFYHSDYSRVDGGAKPPENGRVQLFRHTVYGTLTDGRRNDLRDRILITASPEFADTLPNHQNPRSPNIERLSPYMFIMDRALSLNRWDTFKRYGLDHVIACDFAGTFVKDYSEGFGVRWRPHPSYSLADVAGARQRIKGLGFLFGAYADFTDFYPLNEFWNENLVALHPNGGLRQAWPGSYSPKDSVAWVLTRKVGQKMQEHYPPDCVYLDVSTNRGRSSDDHEAGVPGAGMVRAAIFGVGDSVVEARKWYGSTVSEGIFRWMYAGLTDMDYAQVKMAGPMPLPLDFDLLKLHPFQIGTMMGYEPGRLLSADEVKELGVSREQPAPKAFYKYVATSLAYGHMAMLGYGYLPPMARSIHLYAMMQGLQKEYLPDHAARIEYYNGAAMVTTSQALRTDAHSRGQVRVTYQRGLVVTVNLNPAQDWEVSQAGHTYLLPPYGWIISRHEDNSPAVLAYSASVDGQRLDYVQCPEYVYLNSGDRQRRAGPVEVQGAAWLKREGQDWLVIPCGNVGSWSATQQQEKIPANRGCPVLVVDPAALGLHRPTVTAVGEMGDPVPTTVTTTADGRLQLRATDSTRVFRIHNTSATH